MDALTQDHTTKVKPLVTVTQLSKWRLVMWAGQLSHPLFFTETYFEVNLFIDFSLKSV